MTDENAVPEELPEMTQGWNAETGAWDWGHGYRPDPNNMYWTGASAAFLAMAIFNWFLTWAQYFVYFYLIIGTGPFQNIITAILGLAGGDLSGTSKLTDAFTEMAAKLSWCIPAGLVISSFMNTSSTWWVMIYHTGTTLALWEIQFDQSNTQLHAYWVTVKGFFYSWWIIGWAMPLMMTLDWIMYNTDGSKSTTWHYILILGTWGFWLMTAIVNTWAYSTMQWGWEELMILRSYMHVAIANGEIDQYCFYGDEGCTPGGVPASELAESTDEQLEVPEDDSWNVMSAVVENGISFH